MNKHLSMPRLKAWALCCALLATTAAHAQYQSKVWHPDNGDGTFTNPVINADYSDPDVIAVGDDYYLTASSFNCTPGLPILHSKDLVNWEIVGHALKRLTPDSLFALPAHGKGVWAPSIRYHNGLYYIYWGDPDQGVFMVKAQHPEGPWSDPWMVIAGKGMIDTTPLWDDDGRCYLVNAWANSRSHFASVLTVRELSADGMHAIGDPAIVFDGNDTENHTCEGPKFYKRNGWYWIMCPAGGVTGGFQLAMRSRSPYGPYEAKKVLAQGNTDINGPHQGGWIHTSQGEDWFMHFQDKGPYGRVVHLQPVTWKDNWPVMGRPPKKGYCGEPVTTWRKPKPAAHATVNPQESDEFNTTKLGEQWQWQANYQQCFGMPTAGGFFRLYTWKSNKPIWNTPNLLLQKMPAEKFTMTAKTRMVSKGEQQYAGIIVMGMDYSALVVKRSGDAFLLQQITAHNADKGGSDQATTLAHLDKTSKGLDHYQPSIARDIYLRLTVNSGKADFAYSLDGTHFVPAGTSLTLRPGKWIGAKVGFVAQEPEGNGGRGWLDIDWCRLTP